MTGDYYTHEQVLSRVVNVIFNDSLTLPQIDFWHGIPSLQVDLTVIGNSRRIFEYLFIFYSNPDYSTFIFLINTKKKEKEKIKESTKKLKTIIHSDDRSGSVPL